MNLTSASEVYATADGQIYSRLAELVVLVHLLFVVFVLVGGWFTVRWPRLIWVHLPAAVWGALIEIAGWICPLTPLENWLRRKAGEDGYTGGFIEQHLIPVLYPADLGRTTQLVLGGVVVLVNLLAYGRFCRKRRTRQERQEGRIENRTPEKPGEAASN